MDEQARVMRPDSAAEDGLPRGGKGRQVIVCDDLPRVLQNAPDVWQAVVVVIRLARIQPAWGIVRDVLPDLSTDQFDRTAERPADLGLPEVLTHAAYVALHADLRLSREEEDTPILDACCFKGCAVVEADVVEEEHIRGSARLNVELR